MVTQGCAYTRSIHFCVIVGLVEGRSCVQCAYTSSIHLCADMFNQVTDAILSCFVLFFGWVGHRALIHLSARERR